MFNLLDQANVLKNLDDATLQREASQPSGAVPPYLVLTEINRRKDMRQRYAGELAMSAPKTTVAQDLLAAGSPAAPSGVPVAVLPTSMTGVPGGIDAATGAPPVRGFADGGLTTAAPDYSSLIAQYQSSLADAEAARKREAALALIAAGAGIMSNGSSNTLQNIGAGVQAGLGAYTNLSQADQTAKANALRGLEGITQDQQNAIPANVREFQYFQSLPPDQQSSYIDLTNPTAAFRADQLAAQQDQVGAIGDQIVKGLSPPTFTGLYHLSGPVRAYIGKTYPDFNLSTAQQDFDATKRYLSTLNGPGQVRLRQAVDFTDQSIDKLGALADQWNGGGFPLLNKANLMAAKQGLKGPQAQALATQLDAQIAEVVSELATVYKGGNSPTDEGLKLAATQFSSDWSKDTFDQMVKQIKQNLQYRKNSLTQLVAGTSPNNPYQPSQTVTAGSADVPGSVGQSPVVPDVQWSVEP